MTDGFVSPVFQMMDILFEFVDLSMNKLCPDQGKIEELEDYYQVSSTHRTSVTSTGMTASGVKPQ